MRDFSLCLLILAALPPATRAGTQDLLQAPSENPLLRRPASDPPEAPKPDPWLRKYTGTQIALELTGSAEAGYSGRLQFAGETYPVNGRLSHGKLVGRFSAGDQSFAFEAVLAGDLLRLTSGDAVHELRATPAPKPANPLARPVPGQARPTPETTEEAKADRGTPWSHPQGWFHFEMPRGWSVWRELDDGILLNPGLTESDTLDALIFLNYSELDEEERELAVPDLIRQGEPKLREELVGQGIRIAPASKAPQPVRVGEAPGAIQSWRGQAQGQTGVEVWLGVMVQGEYSLALMAILVGEKGARFRPQAERVFTSLRATPPKTDPALLAGRSFSHSQVYPGSGSFHTIYEFRADGTVRKQMLVSGDVGGSTAEIGRYQVSGDQVTLEFRDGVSRAGIVVENGVVRALRFGNALYRAR